MNKEAVLHTPLSQYAYAVDERSLNIRIRTAKNDITACYLYYGDRVDMVEPIRVTEVQMEKNATDDLFDYYEATVADKYSRVCYYFKLEDGDKEEFYYSRGFCNNMEAHRTEYFQFPYIRREDMLDVPKWASDIVMYHIFPDSFASDKRSLSGIGQQVELNATESGEKIKSVSNLGGTLNGIRENLDYIRDLGVNCIYLNPIFTASSYHKYDTIDYMSIDPCFGTMEDFKKLVSNCHENGIRVILDGVFNHCGSDFFAFRDVLAKGSESRYYDWFYDMPANVEFKDPPEYEAFAYVKEMPKLNTGNSEVIEYFCNVGKYWIEEADIDGWRLDVANEINHDFWREYRKAVRGVKKDCFLIAEIWEEAGIWLQGDQFDSTMNYTFSYLCKDFFATDKISVTEFDEQINKMFMRYSWKTDFCQMNFLDTHDVPRFLSYCGGDIEKLKLAATYMMTCVGIPSIFYGDECAIEGVTEPEYRKEMPWKYVVNDDVYKDISEDLGKAANGTDGSSINNVYDNQHVGNIEELYPYYKKLIRIRNSEVVLRRGSYKTVLTDDTGLYVFVRSLGKEKIYVVFNNSNTDKKCDLSKYVGDSAYELIRGYVTGKEFRVSAKSAMIIKEFLN